MRKRVKKIFNILDKKPDIILIKNSTDPFIDDNFFYVTGLEKGLFEGSVAVLYQDGTVDIIVSELESETAKKADTNITVYKNEKDFNDSLKENISSFKTIGLNFNKISLRDFYKLKIRFPEIEFFDVSQSFIKSRLIKDELEIKIIKKACEIADRVMEKIPQIIHEGMFEFELAAEIDYLLQKNGADKSAFETISSFGKNTSQPHYTHGDTQLKKSNFVLCDFGACLRTYKSDITRTFVFGKASEKQKDMHEIILEAQRIGFETLMPGLNTCDVHNAVNSFIENTKYNGRFIHSTGHSLGLAVHDGYVKLSSECKIELKENMVFTIEPGIYLPEFGGVRIEDDVLIKRDGVELLTKTPKNLIEI